MLRLRLTRILLLIAVSGVLAAQNSAQEVSQQLIQADRGVWAAIAGARPDMEKVSRALAADYVDVDSGERHSRGEVMQYLRGLSNFSFHYDNAKAYVLSPSSGYVIAELTYSSAENGVAAHGRVLTTTVFSKEGGRWLARLHTEMELKPPAPH